MTSAVTLKDVAQYVGMSFEMGKFECSDFAALVLRDLFNRHLPVPRAEDRPKGRATQGAAMRAASGVLADRIDAPVTGALMLCHRRDEEGLTLWHVGIVIVEEGQVWLLHNSRESCGVILQRVEDLQSSGAVVEGYYACR